MGADYYESEEQRKRVAAEGAVPLGIGAGSIIKNCIVDKNARIGKNVTIENKAGVAVSGSMVPEWCSPGRGGGGAGQVTVHHCTFAMDDLT
jgi:UDP-3-O-[3-hydroxymyristoyl] glucosamine N-acyltransferase